MKKTIRWIILILTIIGAVSNLVDEYLSWEVTIYALIYAGLICWLMIGDLRREECCAKKS